MSPHPAVYQSAHFVLNMGRTIPELVQARIDRSGFPVVDQVFRSGRQVFSFARTAPTAALAAR